MFPYVNERMRKRRCFADKDLEAAMFERERVMNEQMKLLQPRFPAIMGVFGAQPTPTGNLPTNLSPKEFLSRLFPAVNPSVLELIFQGCGGNLEKTIEQLAAQTNMAFSNKLQGVGKQAPSPIHPAFITPPSNVLSGFTTNDGILTGVTSGGIPTNSRDTHHERDLIIDPRHRMTPPKETTSSGDELNYRSAFHPMVPENLVGSHRELSKSPCQKQSDTPEWTEISKKDKGPETLLKFSVEALIGK